MLETCLICVTLVFCVILVPALSVARADPLATSTPFHESVDPGEGTSGLQHERSAIESSRESELMSGTDYAAIVVAFREQKRLKAGRTMVEI